MDEPSEQTAAPPRPRGFRRWLRREAIILAVMLSIGLLLPIAVFYTGQVLLGEYSETGAGLGHLYGTVFSDLAAGSPFAWALILGPWLGILLIRVLWWPLGRRRTPAPAPASTES